MLDRPGADPAVGLPEADSVVVSSRGQNDRVAAHRPLVHIHASLQAVTARTEAWTTLHRHIQDTQSAAAVIWLSLNTDFKQERSLIYWHTVEITT